MHNLFFLSKTQARILYAQGWIPSLYTVYNASINQTQEDVSVTYIHAVFAESRRLATSVERVGAGEG
jgi:hypothetical protein